MEFMRVPEELKQRDQWVLWKLTEKGKEPFQLNGKLAKSTDPLHWSNFDEVVKAYEVGQGVYNGIGYVFSKDDPYTGIDLDDCFIDGELTGEAQQIVGELGSYTELSQSGNGLHIFVKASKPGTRSKNTKQGFEMYEHSRFFVVTGSHLSGTPETIEERQHEVDNLYERMFGRAKEKKASRSIEPKSPPMDDTTILSIAQSAKNNEKFNPLYAGDISGYGSHSEADQALCNLLAFYTQIPEQIDRLFRGSGLMRDKWEREEYSESTINKAIEDLTAWYGWPVIDLGDGEKKTQSQLIVELTNGMEFFRTADNEAYARLLVRGHYENWKVRSTSFRTLLAKLFYDRHKRPPGGQAVSDALNVLEGKAIHEGDERTVYLRVAKKDDAIYLDLCNGEWQAVMISEAGWQIIDNPPVMFRRTKTMAALPSPVAGGNIEQLRPFLNVKDIDDFMLCVAWILSTFRDNYPFPILTIQGEQGSAKSTTTRVIRSLVDPSTQPLTSFPDNERDMAIKANGTWIIAFDNLSGIPGKMSDVLCKLSTGGGFSTRKLHTDDEEMIFNAMRPMILNGIDDIAKRPDLLDRAIVLNLPTIDSSGRKTEREFWQEFELVRPMVLGALLDAAAKAFRHVHKVEITDMPRMIDFATWSEAAWQAMGWDWIYGDFMDMYNNNRQMAIDQGIESDPLASAIIREMEDKSEWSGTVSQILEQLALHVSFGTTMSRAWPAPNRFRDRVRRIAPGLRTKGINYTELKRTSAGVRLRFYKETDDVV